MNTERSISVSTILAVSCWLVGLAGAVVNIIVEPDVGTLAGAFLAAAICLTIRSSIKAASTSALVAFKFGKEAGHREAGGPRGI